MQGKLILFSFWLAEYKDCKAFIFRSEELHFSEKTYVSSKKNHKHLLANLIKAGLSGVLVSLKLGLGGVTVS